MARLSAKHASLYIGGLKVADMQNLSINIETNMEDGSAWEDDWECPEPMLGRWTATAERFCSAIAAGFMTDAAGTPEVGATYFRIIAYQTEGVAGSRVFEGDCWFAGAGMSMPKSGFIVHNVSFTGYGAPVYVR
jgi:hypothetical protein